MKHHLPITATGNNFTVTVAPSPSIKLLHTRATGLPESLQSGVSHRDGCSCGTGKSSLWSTGCASSGCNGKRSRRGRSTASRFDGPTTNMTGVRSTSSSLTRSISYWQPGGGLLFDGDSRDTIEDCEKRLFQIVRAADGHPETMKNLIDRIRKDCPDSFRMLLSMYTRAPLPGDRLSIWHGFLRTLNCGMRFRFAQLPDDPDRVRIEPNWDGASGSGQLHMWMFGHLFLLMQESLGARLGNASTVDLIKAFQAALAKFGFPSGDIDGVWDNETKAAFQKYKAIAYGDFFRKRREVFNRRNGE